MAMTNRAAIAASSAFALLALLLLLLLSPRAAGGDGRKSPPQSSFQTSDRCLACHNGIRSPTGEDVSIGFAWRSSIMANSSRDPYWQGSVRRELIDHPESQSLVEDECSVCHMPITRFEARQRGASGEVFAHLPFDQHKKDSAHAEDGVSCSVCHQISKDKLGTPESYNGGFVVSAPASHDEHPEYGPFSIDAGRQRIMHTSTAGFRPIEQAHIRDSALCGTCHTLKTVARGANGKEVGALPEQMPYVEWLHSDYPGRSTCQSCHMPENHGEVAISAVLGQPRAGTRRHSFVGANFFMLNLLNLYRDELSVTALPAELTESSRQTAAFLQNESVRLTISSFDQDSGTLRARLLVQNLTGHKMPTAYPSRRAWLHVTIYDSEQHKIFESGALHPDGSIEGNDNDRDASQFAPHYREITKPDQVQIYEPILGDAGGHVTTGLLSAVGYLKDNRLLPSGFRKDSAGPDIAVVGDAADDPDFTDAGNLVRYSVSPGDAKGPFRIQVELLYQPIGYRWAHNLGTYQAAEPRRFVRYYESMASASATTLAHAEAETGN